MPEIICLGEILVDMFSTQAGVSLEKAPAFLPVPGGAPANVAIGLGKLGVDSALISKVGDVFGESGQPDDLIKKYGLSWPDIVKTARKALSSGEN